MIGAALALNYCCLCTLLGRGAWWKGGAGFDVAMCDHFNLKAGFPFDSQQPVKSPPDGSTHADGIHGGVGPTSSNVHHRIVVKRK